MMTTNKLDDFAVVMQGYQQRIENQLQQCLPSVNKLPQQLHEAMRYASLGGGKRLRALLVYLCGTTLGASLDQLDASACAVELIHAYSLIHDDLPAMDNSALRRGKPTCHIAFDEATAILAGDALQALAFEILNTYKSNLPAATQLQMTTCLAQACGTSGMAGGQALDLLSTNQPLTLDELIYLHRLKTGKLIEASAMLGALAAQTHNNVQLNAIQNYAHHLGLAFQIKDDILDVESDTATLGKPQGIDSTNQKNTFVTLLGLAGAHDFLHDEYHRATSALGATTLSTPLLQALASFVVYRKS
jgi:farnesyl diphosphate synthase